MDDGTDRWRGSNWDGHLRIVRWPWDRQRHALHSSALFASHFFFDGEGPHRFKRTPQRHVISSHIKCVSKDLRMHVADLGQKQSPSAFEIQSWSDLDLRQGVDWYGHERLPAIITVSFVLPLPLSPSLRDGSEPRPRPTLEDLMKSRCNPQRTLLRIHSSSKYDLHMDQIRSCGRVDL